MQLYIPALASRPDTKKVAILITDGVPNVPSINQQFPNDPENTEENRKATTAAANRLKDLGVTVFCVGVAIQRASDKEYLQTLASNPDLYTSVTDFADLEQFVSDLVQQSCGMSDAPVVIKQLGALLSRRPQG